MPKLRSAADTDRIIELRAAGYTQARIAAELGVSRPAISAALKRLEVTSPNRIHIRKARNREIEAVSEIKNVTQNALHEDRVTRPLWKRFPTRKLEAVAEAYEELRSGMIASHHPGLGTTEAAWQRAYGHKGAMEAVVERYTPRVGVPA